MTSLYFNQTDVSHYITVKIQKPGEKRKLLLKTLGQKKNKNETPTAATDEGKFKGTLTYVVEQPMLCFSALLTVIIAC